MTNIHNDKVGTHSQRQNILSSLEIIHLIEQIIMDEIVYLFIFTVLPSMGVDIFLILHILYAI